MNDSSNLMLDEEAMKQLREGLKGEAFSSQQEINQYMN